MNYTPDSKAFADRLLLDYARTRALEGHAQADDWLARQIAMIHAGRTRYARDNAEAQSILTELVPLADHALLVCAAGLLPAPDAFQAAILRARNWLRAIGQ